MHYMWCIWHGRYTAARRELSLHTRPADPPPLKRSDFIYPRFSQALAASEARVCVFDLQAVRGLCSSSSGQERRHASYIPPTERLARLQAAAGFAGFAVEERADLVAANVLEIRFGAKLAVEHEVDGNVGVVFPQGVAKGKKKTKKGTQKLCSGDGCPNKANARDGSAIIVPESRGRSKAAPPRCKHEAGRKARRSRCGRNCLS